MFRTERINVSTKVLVTIGLCRLMMIVLQTSGLVDNASQSVSWFTWLMGQSVSFEFHFLDLLELLSR